MTLSDQFKAWITDAERLRLLYETLLTKNRRAIRPEWRERFFKARLTTWPQNQGLWRSTNTSVLVVGQSHLEASHKTFNAEGLAVPLRSALLLYMAAVDKILHEALSKHFSKLAKRGFLDELVEIDLSRAYWIAQHARVPTGKGGKIKKRPGHDLKAEMLNEIYNHSYLKTSNLEKVCAACGKKKIFSKFADANPPDSGKNYKDRWSCSYLHRNRIAHECDVVRKAKPRRVQFNEVNVAALQRDLDFLKRLGEYLAQELD